MPTYCEDCDNVETSSRKKHPKYWLCLKHKRLEGMGFVAPELWADREPYMSCININGGACPLWTPRREQHEQEQIK